MWITVLLIHLQFCLDGQTVAIDGKTLRGSHDKTAGLKPLHVVNVWANQVKFCLGQVSVSEKSNEIPAVQELLEILNLKDAVVTADAMHCQKKTAKKSIEAEADSLLQVKNNQPTLMQSIAEIFDEHEADTVITALAGTTWTPDVDLSSGQHRWWICGVAANGRKGASSNVATIDTDGRAVLETQPGVTTDATPRVTWRPVESGSHYEMNVSRSDGSLLLRRNNIASIEFDLPPMAGGNDRIWVKAISNSDTDTATASGKPSRDVACRGRRSTSRRRRRTDGTCRKGDFDDPLSSVPLKSHFNGKIRAKRRKY